jgi:hypothetical protein
MKISNSCSGSGKNASARTPAPPTPKSTTKSDIYSLCIYLTVIVTNGEEELMANTNAKMPKSTTTNQTRKENKKNKPINVFACDYKYTVFVSFTFFLSWVPHVAFACPFEVSTILKAHTPPCKSSRRHTLLNP